MKLKDYFTLGNLLCGFASVVALFHDRFDWACYLIYIGYVFDVLDGPVARLTKQHDKFGGLFDAVSDYITNSIAVSFIIFYAFWKNAHYPWLLAAVIGAFPFTFGTIRQARSMERDLTYPCYWLGVPRPVLAIFILALLNSSLFTIAVSPWREVANAVAALLVAVGSILHLSKLPFINHHERRWSGIHLVGMLTFIAGTPVAFLVGWLVLGWPAFVYNYILCLLILYLFLSWVSIPRTDLRRIRAYLAGGPLVKPLVHKDSSWRSRTLADYWVAEDVDDPARPDPAAPPDAGQTSEGQPSLLTEGATPPISRHL
jgi:CDP-diacylglycerol--serine O-phosphatidyltransferase